VDAGCMPLPVQSRSCGWHIVGLPPLGLDCGLWPTLCRIYRICQMWTKSETCPKYEWPYIIFDDLVLTITVKVVWFCYNNYHIWMFRWLILHYDIKSIESWYLLRVDIYWELISIESWYLLRVNVYGEWMSMESECLWRANVNWELCLLRVMSIESSCLLRVHVYWYHIL